MSGVVSAVVLGGSVLGGLAGVDSGAVVAARGVASPAEVPVVGGIVVMLVPDEVGVAPASLGWLPEHLRRYLPQGDPHLWPDTMGNMCVLPVV